MSSDLGEAAIHGLYDLVGIQALVIQPGSLHALGKGRPYRGCVPSATLHLGRKGRGGGGGVGSKHVLAVNAHVHVYFFLLSAGVWRATREESADLRPQFHVFLVLLSLFFVSIFHFIGQLV